MTIIASTAAAGSGAATAAVLHIGRYDRTDRVVPRGNALVAISLLVGEVVDRGGTLGIVVRFVVEVITFSDGRFRLTAATSASLARPRLFLLIRPAAIPTARRHRRYFLRLLVHIHIKIGIQIVDGLFDALAFAHGRGAFPTLFTAAASTATTAAPAFALPLFLLVACAPRSRTLVGNVEHIRLIELGVVDGWLIAGGFVTGPQLAQAGIEFFVVPHIVVRRSM
jgi:hypothetical protein